MADVVKVSSSSPTSGSGKVWQARRESSRRLSSQHAGQVAALAEPSVRWRSSVAYLGAGARWATFPAMPETQPVGLVGIGLMERSPGADSSGAGLSVSATTSDPADRASCNARRAASLDLRRGEAMRSDPCSPCSARTGRTSGSEGAEIVPALQGRLPARSCCAPRATRIGSRHSARACCAAARGASQVSRNPVSGTSGQVRARQRRRP
jgi:hypothetical protein